MARAAGRRPDETASEQSQARGPETGTLGLIAGLLVLAVIALVLFAGR